jgi:hypothetical protein
MSWEASIFFRLEHPLPRSVTLASIRNDVAMKPILLSLVILAIITVSISGGTNANHSKVDKVVSGSVSLKGNRVIKH